MSSLSTIFMIAISSEKLETFGPSHFLLLHSHQLLKVIALIGDLEI